MCAYCDWLIKNHRQVYSSRHEILYIDSHLKSGGLYKGMMPLCGPVCGLSFALISEKEGDCKNLITIALTVGIKFSVIEAEDRVIHISLS